MKPKNGFFRINSAHCISCFSDLGKRCHFSMRAYTLNLECCGHSPGECKALSFEIMVTNVNKKYYFFFAESIRNIGCFVPMRHMWFSHVACPLRSILTEAKLGVRRTSPAGAL